ncbi:hypothetical protein KAFR_0B05290 [Kazachstania africana CBS 2517]|uniref:MADS-box domain-containing protein n=1 Tax=Kazachstania africana (strain ATCC 22294 / BCRC 22015 / CBS 2517 / CECT 1963 / NBRC 1671 / NRRL Y-8276) TaxID=1071382 RepID=H2AR24_KAZAF|nr:hypothetical protein KAFR_0B05290 [Kazachstania africana CBS 2517]CCF56824.1 hypothetical protein KAFR_0B05290 [Kazachstania africana CBS 2517]
MHIRSGATISDMRNHSDFVAGDLEEENTKEPRRPPRGPSMNTTSNSNNNNVNKDSLVEGTNNETSIPSPEDSVEEEEEDYDLKRARRKNPIKYIENKTRRQVTFAKRRHGLMKKAYELSVMTGANILLLIVSNTGLVYTFTTPKLEPVVINEEGKNLIRACLNAEDN